MFSEGEGGGGGGGGGGRGRSSSLIILLSRPKNTQKQTTQENCQACMYVRKQDGRSELKRGGRGVGTIIGGRVPNKGGSFSPHPPLVKTL